MRHSMTFKAAWALVQEHLLPGIGEGSCLCGATSFLSQSIWTYQAYQCPAWRRPFRRASPESAPWLSPWGTWPPWAEPSYTPPVTNKRQSLKLNPRLKRWSADVLFTSHETSRLTILLLISWKWISHTFSTTSSFSNVTKPNPGEEEASVWVEFLPHSCYKTSGFRQQAFLRLSATNSLQ